MLTFQPGITFSLSYFNGTFAPKSFPIFFVLEYLLLKPTVILKCGEKQNETNVLLFPTQKAHKHQ